jgi:hypothetical protein
MLNGTFPMMAPDTVGKLSDVLYDNAAVPMHTVTLFNNSDKTVYPILYAENSTTDNQMFIPGTKDPNPYFGKALFDVHDDLNHEYRGYVGYQNNGVNYLGLPAHSKVTIDVPLVFWDSGRIAIATDGSLSQTDNIVFNYHSDSARHTTDAANYHLAPGTGGIVQWYEFKKGLAEIMSTAAPAQLLELTIRDAWMKNLPNWADISVQAKIDKAFTATDYDVSYVDAMMLPAGMEVSDATVLFLKDGEAHYREPFGWIGADLKTTHVQNQIKLFTTNTPTAGFPKGYLGTYFGGLGYDQYYSTLAGAGISIPAGNDLFADGSVSDAPSPYDVGYFKLTSGGKIYNPQPNIAMPGTTADKEYTLSGLDPAVVAQLAPGMLVKYGDALNHPKSPILQSSTIVSIKNDTTILMSNPASQSVTRNYTFEGSQFTGEFHTAAGDDSKLIATDPAVVARLVVGMLVSGPDGITPGTRIKSIAPDDTYILLTGAVPTSPSPQNYTFKGGISDVYSSTLANLWYGWAEYYRSEHRNLPDIPFSNQVNPVPLAPTDKAFAVKFAALVYDVMANFGKIPFDKNKVESGSTQIMQNIIGDNVGFLNLPKAEEAKVTNEVISIMRGVLDYRDPATVKDWYSSPTANTTYGGAMINGTPATYNVYNLNPYVWFVKKELGLTGYAFSVDDGISNINAAGATKLLVTIGPISDPTNGTLPNTLKYGKNTNFGPITLKMTQVNTTTLKIDNPADYWMLGEIGEGATVRSTGGDVINPHTTVLGQNDKEHWIVLNPETPLKPNSDKNTYTFYDPGINGPLS